MTKRNTKYEDKKLSIETTGLFQEFEEKNRTQNFFRAAESQNRK